MIVPRGDKRKEFMKASTATMATTATAPDADDDAKTLLHMHGFDAENVRLEVLLENGGIWSGEPFLPIAFFAYVGDLQMCEWLFAHGAAPDRTQKSKRCTRAHPCPCACVIWRRQKQSDVTIEGGGIRLDVGSG